VGRETQKKTQKGGNLWDKEPNPGNKHKRLHVEFDKMDVVMDQPGTRKWFFLWFLFGLDVKVEF